MSTSINPEDPLRYPVEKVRDLEFLPDGKVNMAVPRKIIAKWQDREGHTLYTNENNLSLEQVRALRDKVVSQQSMFNALSETDRGKPEAALLYQDFLHSRLLGERFVDMKQNPKIFPW